MTIGRYGPGGLTLSGACEKCIAAKNALAQGHSPARIKQREKRQLATTKTLRQFATKWLEEGPMAESTRAMRKGIYRREVEPEYSNRLLNEVSSDDVRSLCTKVKIKSGSTETGLKKVLAHEKSESSRGTYNKAQYAEQRRHMLQEWADMIDAWVAGRSHTPTLPPCMKVITSQALT